MPSVHMCIWSAYVDFPATATCYPQCCIAGGDCLPRASVTCLLLAVHCSYIYWGVRCVPVYVNNACDSPPRPHSHARYDCYAGYASCQFQTARSPWQHLLSEEQHPGSSHVAALQGADFIGASKDHESLNCATYWRLLAIRCVGLGTGGSIFEDTPCTTHIRKQSQRKPSATGMHYAGSPHAKHVAGPLQQMEVVVWRQSWMLILSSY
jgi:hypothetical protein